MTAVRPEKGHIKIPSAPDGSGAEGAGSLGGGHALAACDNSAVRGPTHVVAPIRGRCACRMLLSTSLSTLGRVADGLPRAPFFAGAGNA